MIRSLIEKFEELKKEKKSKPYGRDTGDLWPMDEKIPEDKIFRNDPTICMEFANALANTDKLFPDYHTYLLGSMKKWREYMKGSEDSLEMSDMESAVSILKYVLSFVEERSEEEGKRVKSILATTEEILRSAHQHLDNDDFVSAMNDFNSYLECFLKEYLRIPMTLGSARVSNILDTLKFSTTSPFYDFLEEVQKNVLQVDNKIKHQKYKPSRQDCINAGSSLEGLSKEIERGMITDDLKVKVYEMLKLKKVKKSSLDQGADFIGLKSEKR